MDNKHKNEDYISELPDCVLGNIVSRLSLKDEAKTSVLSRRWRHIYSHRMHICVDFLNMFNKMEQKVLYKEQNEFKKRRKELCERTDHMMRLFRWKNITSLTVALFMDAECSSHIDEWIGIAVESGVKKIELLFAPCWNFIDTDKIEAVSQYSFPRSLFLEQRTSMLQHLHLYSCVLKAPGGFHGFTCLKVLQLEHVFLAEDFANLLFICPQLENLMLKSCNLESSYLKITGPSSLHLVHLKVLNCRRLTVIEIFAMNLITFEYLGDSKRILLKAPKLDRMFSWPRGLTMLPTLPLLETLTLNLTEGQVMKFPESIGVLKNLEQLSVFVCCHSKNFQLLRLLSLLMASPLVQKFVVMLSARKFDSRSEISENQDECITFHNHHHHQLKEFEVHGCVGNWYEIEFVKSVLKMASGLENMALGPSNTIYCGNGMWRDLYKGGWHDYLSSSCYDSCKEEMREKLQDYISPTIQFVML